MRVVVIGTSGQLATELHRAPRASSLELLPPEKVELADQAAVSALLDRARPELVINAAAYTAVDRAETERERAFAVNAQGPAGLAAWCAQRRAALVHVSTDYVFDGQSSTPYQVDDPCAPINVYGESKLAGEALVRENLARHLIIRTSWVFSAHGQNFVKTMLRLAAQRDELRVVGDQLGCPTSAAGLAAAIWQLSARLAAGAELAWGTYHLTGAQSMSWHRFAEAIVRLQQPFTKKSPPVIPIGTSDFPTPARRPRYSVLDSGAFQRAFGIEPEPLLPALDAVVRELSGPS